VLEKNVACTPFDHYHKRTRYNKLSILSYSVFDTARV